MIFMSSCFRDLRGVAVGPFSNLFSSKTLSFLRALKRHNDREWFRARKDEDETHVRGPMIAVAERLPEDPRAFAPGPGASPRRPLFRPSPPPRFRAAKNPPTTT